MIKAIRLVRRNPDLAPHEFRWRWLLEHGSALREAVAQSPLARATASFARERQITDYGEGHQVPVELDFDGMESLYFPTLGALREALDSGVLAALDRSLATVAAEAPDVPRHVTLEETMARRPDCDALLGNGTRMKLARTLIRKEGTDLYQFRDHWHNHHRHIETRSIYLGPTPLINVSFSIGQVVGGGELRAPADRDGVMGFDGVIEIFFPSDLDLLGMYSTPFTPETRRDELNFLSMDAPIRRALMDEHVLA
jgi:hypothetical protein